MNANEPDLRTRLADVTTLDELIDISVQLTKRIKVSHQSLIFGILLTQSKQEKKKDQVREN